MLCMLESLGVVHTLLVLLTELVLDWYCTGSHKLRARMAASLTSYSPQGFSDHLSLSV